jgi:hypothetical protein
MTKSDAKKKRRSSDRRFPFDNPLGGENHYLRSESLAAFCALRVRADISLNQLSEEQAATFKVITARTVAIRIFFIFCFLVKGLKVSFQSFGHETVRTEDWKSPKHIRLLTMRRVFIQVLF